MSKSDIPLQLRFPKRLAKVTHVGAEIARTVGTFSNFGDVAGGRLTTALVEEFHIIYFTPFNQPTLWWGIDWHDEKVRCFLHGLVIRQGRSTCLAVVWDDEQIFFGFVRRPSKDNWDRRLRKLWNKINGELRARCYTHRCYGLEIPG
jgi:hypothetical protein